MCVVVCVYVLKEIPRGSMEPKRKEEEELREGGGKGIITKCACIKSKRH